MNNKIVQASLCLILTILPIIGIKAHTFDFTYDTGDIFVVNGISYVLHEDNFYSYSMKETAAVVVPPTTGCYGGDIILPETVTINDIEYPVYLATKHIWDADKEEFKGPFVKNEDITSIDISNLRQKIIEAYTFLECKNLTSIKFPKNLSEVENDALSYTGFDELDIPAKIGYFAGGENLRKIRIRKASYTCDFSLCKNLEAIVYLDRQVGDFKYTLPETMNHQVAFYTYSGSDPSYGCDFFGNSFTGISRPIENKYIKPHILLSSNYAVKITEMTIGQVTLSKVAVPFGDAISNEEFKVEAKRDSYDRLTYNSSQGIVSFPIKPWECVDCTIKFNNSKVNSFLYFRTFSPVVTKTEDIGFNKAKIILKAHFDTKYDGWQLGTIHILDSDYSSLGTAKTITLNKGEFEAVFELKKLTPGNHYSPCYVSYNPYVSISSVMFRIPGNGFITRGIGLYVNGLSVGPTMIDYKFGYSVPGDVIISNTKMSFNGTVLTENTGRKYGLSPKSRYTLSGYVEYKVPGEGIITETVSKDITLKELTLTTSAPKIVASQVAVVRAQTNAEDGESNIGFEWRKIDAPDLIPSNSAYGQTFGGNVEGRIVNLNASTYYKVRAFYKSIDGDYTQYGEWIGFDPSDFSYFEPTVYTYDMATVSNVDVKVKGFYMPGTENIEDYGFEYWLQSSPTDVQVASGVETRASEDFSGKEINVAIKGLTAKSIYEYRAFARTAQGSFYGATKTFKTNADTTTDIENITDNPQKSDVAINQDDIYNLQGVLVKHNATKEDLKTLNPGFYILNGRKYIVH